MDINDILADVLVLCAVIKAGGGEDAQESAAWVADRILGACKMTPLPRERAFVALRALCESHFTLIEDPDGELAHVYEKLVNLLGQFLVYHQEFGLKKSQLN